MFNAAPKRGRPRKVLLPAQVDAKVERMWERDRTRKRDQATARQAEADAVRYLVLHVSAASKTMPKRDTIVEQARTLLELPGLLPAGVSVASIRRGVDALVEIERRIAEQARAHGDETARDRRELVSTALDHGLDLETLLGLVEYSDDHQRFVRTLGWQVTHGSPFREKPRPAWIDTPRRGGHAWFESPNDDDIPFSKGN